MNIYMYVQNWMNMLKSVWWTCMIHWMGIFGCRDLLYLINVNLILIHYH